MKYILIALAPAFCSLFMNFSQAQTATADNKLSQTITFRPIPKGPSVLGVFEGRPPCAGLAKQLKITTTADCIKLKCDLTLYRDPATNQATTYVLTIVGGGDLVQQDGNSYRLKRLEGKWKIVKGTKFNPDDIIYQLELDKPGDYLYMLKGDDNVLFILDENKEFRVGDEDFCYTLNRVELVPANK